MADDDPAPATGRPQQPGIGTRSSVPLRDAGVTWLLVRSARRALAIACVLPALLAGSARAQSCPGALLAQLPEGPVQSVALTDAFHYIGAGAALVTYSIADPVDPVRTGTAALHGLAVDVAIGGAHLYVAAREAGLEILDLSDPSAPTPLARLRTISSAQAVAVEATRAYIAETNGLRVVDVSDPAAPSSVGFLSQTPGALNDLAVAGSHVFAVFKTYLNHGLAIFDVAGPKPRLVGQLELYGNEYTQPRSLALAGDLVYVVAGLLTVVDVSEPASPVVVGVFDPGPSTFLYSVALAGNRAYVASSAGLRIVDVADPQNPVEIGALPTAVGRRVAAAAGLAAVGAWESPGSELIDVSDPANPVSIWLYDAPPAVSAVAASGAELDLATTEGLSVLDVSQPSAPVALGALALTGSMKDVQRSGDFAYLSGWLSPFHVVDLSDPAHPALVGSSPTGGGGLAVAAGRAYLWDSTSDLVRVMDVTNPALPVQIGEHDFGFRVTALLATGSIVYVSTSNEVVVLEWSNPAFPVQLAALNVSADGMAMADGVLALVSGGNRLDILDVTNPALPISRATRVFAEQIGPDVAVTSSYVVTGRWERGGGLMLVDISTPTLPMKVGAAEIPYAAVDIAAAGETIYTANGVAGISLFSASALGACWLFSDGFESGDTARWSASQP